MYLTDTRYPALRGTLATEYLEASDEQLDALVAALYGEGASAEDVENFLRSLGRGFGNVAKGVGRFARNVGPGIAQGALTGAGVGGPFGALAGAVVGGAGSALSRSGNRTLRGIGGALGGVTQLASNFSPTGRLGQLAGVGLGALGQLGRRGGGRAALGQLAGGAMNLLGGGGGGAGGLAGNLAGMAGQLLGGRGGRGGGGGLAGGAANALLGMLSRPETMRALGAAAMAPAGRPNVQVGAQAVPVQSILNALGGLAGRAAREMEAAEHQGHHSHQGPYPEWYFGADGELAIDPADAEQRTDALLELFAETPAPAGPMAWHHFEQAVETEAEAYDPGWPRYTAAHAAHDAWLMEQEALADSSEAGADPWAR